MQSDAAAINLCITTHCNMRCPDCFMGIDRQKRHMTMQEIERVAECFHGINQVKFTGGEPSVHPQFQEIASRARELFGCKELACDTNGTRFKEIPAAFAAFDFLAVSHYGEWTYPGHRDNTEDIAFLRNYYSGAKPRILIEKNQPLHHKLSWRGTKPCDRIRNKLVSVCDMKVYPCCVGPGLSPDISAPVSPEWRKDIEPLIPPCQKCCFANP